MTTLPILEWSALAIAFLLEMGFFWRLLEKQKELEQLKVVLHEKRHELGMREADYLAKYGALQELLQELVPKRPEMVEETCLPILRLRVTDYDDVVPTSFFVKMDYDGVGCGAVFGLDRRLMLLRDEINLAERLAPDLLRQMFAAIEQHRREYLQSHNAKGVPDATPSGEKEKSLDTT